RVAFMDGRAGDLNKAALGAELLDRAGAAVAHAGPEAADELEDVVGQGPLVGHAALDPLGDELLGRGALGVAAAALGGALLAVAFVRPLCHRADGAHAAIGLEAAAAEDDGVAGALGQAGEQPAD